MQEKWREGKRKEVGERDKGEGTEKRKVKGD